MQVLMMKWAMPSLGTHGAQNIACPHLDHEVHVSLLELAEITFEEVGNLTSHGPLT